MSNSPFEKRRIVEERIKELDAKILVCQSTISNTSKAVSKYQAQLKQAQNDLKNLDQPKPITVSDHALVRYMQRHMGINLEDVCKEIITEQLQMLVGTVGGTGKFPLEHGRIVMKEYTIITYVSNNEADNEE